MFLGRVELPRPQILESAFDFLLRSRRQNHSTPHCFLLSNWIEKYDHVLLRAIYRRKRYVLIVYLIALGPYLKLVLMRRLKA